MLKAYVGQMQIAPGAVEANLARAQEVVAESLTQAVDLVVLPGWCLSGQLRGGGALQQELQLQCVQAGLDLGASARGKTLIFGNVEREGKGAAIWVFDAEGKLHICAPETVLTIEIAGQKWRLGLSFSKQFSSSPHLNSNLYLSANSHFSANLSATVRAEPVDLWVVCGGDPYLRTEDYAGQFWANWAQVLKAPLLYANGVGWQNDGDHIYAMLGHSAAFGADGQMVAQLPPGLAQNAVIAWKVAGGTTVCNHSALELILCALRRAVGDYMAQNNLRKVVVGASGGIDSAVVAALLVHICGPENVLLISMPSQYNSGTTQRLARELAHNLGCYFATVGIDQSVAHTQAQISGLSITTAGGAAQTLTLSPFHLENVQARDRSGRILAAAAAAWGGVFSCNANKAESTVGYSTLYGDHGGFLALLGDLWKHQVYALGAFLNERIFKSEVIPAGIFAIKPSAELSPQQNPEQGGGDPLHYWYHDQLLAAFTEKGWGPTHILQVYNNGELESALQLARPLSDLFATPAAFADDLHRWWRQYIGPGAYKRIQAPPALMLSQPLGTPPDYMFSA